MTALLAAVATALGHVLGLGRPLAVPVLPVPAMVPCAPRTGQVDRVAALPGEWTPPTGSEP